MKQVCYYILLVILSVSAFAQDDDALAIMGDSVLFVERVNLCAEIDIEGIAADDSFPGATILGDFVFWDRDFDYFLSDSCYWDYRCTPRHILDGYDTSLQFRLALWRYGFGYCGVFSPDGDTSAALFLLCNGEMKPVATWGRPFTAEDILTGAFFTLDYSQNLLAQFLHHQYEMITDLGYVVSGALPILRDRLCLDAPDDSSGAYLYGFNLLSYALFNNLHKPVWSVASMLQHIYTGGLFSGCWYAGIPIIDGPYGESYFVRNEFWCAMCSDSAGLTSGTQSRGFRIQYAGAEHSAIRMRGGSNNLTEAWGYLDGTLRMHIVNCCTRDFPDANYYTFDTFPDSVRLVTYDNNRNIASQIRMAVLADSVWIDDVWESPSTGLDGNPSPLVLKIAPGWNGSLYPEMTISPAETLMLGNVIVGETVLSEFTLTNVGDTTLIITELSHTDTTNFDIYYLPHIPAGGAGNISVQFTPSSAGRFVDTIIVYTNVPCFPIVYLYVVGEGINVSPLVPEIVEPLPNSWTSCSDQQILINTLCQESLFTEIESVRVNSSPTVVEYYDSTLDSWVPAESVWSSAWGTHLLDGTCWLWDDHFDYGECILFRVIISLPEGVAPDSASITIYADNQATVYVNGNYVDTTHSVYWYSLKTFDISPYLHGGEDTVLIYACDISGVIAGIDFYIVAFFQRVCCRAVDISSVVMNVDGVLYTGASSNVSISDDTLIVFTPIAPDTFADGDTISVCLVEAADTCGEQFDGLPLCWDFYVDITPPAVWNIFPPPDTVLDEPLPQISMCLWDSLSGLDSATVELTVNGAEIEPDFVPSDSCILVEWLFSEPLHWGDTITFCIFATDTTEYCEDNYLDTCFTFYIYSQGPVAWFSYPSFHTITACLDDEIWIVIADSQGVDSTTIILAVNSDTFTCEDMELSFIEDSLLIFSPAAGYWDGQDTVYVKLLSANDLLGAPLQNIAELVFFTDFVPPQIQLLAPATDDWVQDMLAPLEFQFSDEVSPILINLSWIAVDEDTFPIEELILSLSADSASGYLQLNPVQYGFHWNPGDTINVMVHLCDRPDTCGPNCADSIYQFRFEPTTACFVHPNPFTPNEDGINDIAVFDYPRMFVQYAMLKIYNLRGELVFEKRLGPIAKNSDFDVRCWDGKDEVGQPLKPGVYLYVISNQDNEVICHGTVVLVR